jgi:hypothetical protein
MRCCFFKLGIYNIVHVYRLLGGIFLNMEIGSPLQNRRRFIQDWNSSKRKREHGKCQVIFCENTVVSQGVNSAAVVGNRKSLCVFACCPRDSETGCVLQPAVR